MTVVMVSVLGGLALVAILAQLTGHPKTSRVAIGGAVLVAVVYIIVALLGGLILSISLPIAAVLGGVGIALMITGIRMDYPRITTIGVGVLVVLLYLAFGLGIWFLVLGLVGVVLLLLHAGDGQNWLAALAALVLAISGIIGVSSYHSSANAAQAELAQRVDQLEKDLLNQVLENNSSFASWDELCAKAKAGSAEALTCEKVNALQGQVDQNTSDIAALQQQVSANTNSIKTIDGQVAKVTERVTKDEVTIKSNSDAITKLGTSAVPPAKSKTSKTSSAKPAPAGKVDQDKVAVTALAKQLAQAGWGPKDVNINHVDESIKTDQQGAHAFGDRIRTKTQLVKVLNGSSAQDRAIRNRVLSAVPADQRARLLRGDGYYALQFKQSLCISGSDWFKNGKDYPGNGVINCHAAGDVYWVYVGSDGVVYWGATVRDDCNNPHLDTAPAPQHKKPAKELCPPDTDRAGQMIGAGCNYPHTTTTTTTNTQTQVVTSTVPVTSVTQVTNSTEVTHSTDVTQTHTTGVTTTATVSTTPTKPNTSSTSPHTSTPPTTDTSTTPPQTTSLASKTGHNPAITQSESHTVNTNDGRTDSQGLQTDPAGDAAQASKSAAKSNSSVAAAASSSAAQADTDSGGGSDPHGNSSPTSDTTAAQTTDTGPAGEDTSGCIWDGDC